MKFKHLILAACLVCTGSLLSQAQTMNDVIQKHLAAIGGADNYRKVNSVVMKGNIIQGGTKIPVSITVQQNKGARIEFTFNGMTGYQILTDTAGWGFNPFQGQTKAEPITQDEVKKSQDQLDLLDEFVDYDARGIKLEDLGTDEVDGTEAYKIRVTYKNGKQKTLYISKDDYLTLRTTEKTEINGKEFESTSDLSNYKKTGEVVMPYSINNSLQGNIEIDTIEINSTINPDVFKPNA